MEKNFFNEGLRCITLSDLLRSEIKEDVNLKLKNLNSKMLGEDILQGRVRTLYMLLEDVLYRDYHELSVYAFSRIVLAIDYFLRTYDDTPDHQEGGYSDDLRHVSQVFSDLRLEIEHYKSWKAAQPKGL